MLSKSFTSACALAACLAASFSASLPAAAQEGMTVVRDADTGKLRPATSSELRAMQDTAVQPRTVQKSAKPSVRADGTRAVELGERGLVYSVAKRGPDGKVKRVCTRRHDTAPTHPADSEVHHEHN